MGGATDVAGAYEQDAHMRVTLTLEKRHKQLKYIEKGCHFRHGSQDIVSAAWGEVTGPAIDV